MTNRPPALLLVGHDARDEDGAAAFRAFVADLAKRNPEVTVAGGLAEPSPQTGGSEPAGAVAGPAGAVAELAGSGVTGFAAVPLILGSAGHAKDGVPAAVATLAALAGEKVRHPGISYSCGRPLGPLPSLLPVLERRVEEALDGNSRTAGTGTGTGTGTDTAHRSPGDRAGTTVLLVGGGSTEPEVNAEVHKAARLLWEGRGYAGVEVAFVSMAAPDVASGLDRCRKLGARKVVVLPGFLFPGGPPERIRMQAEGWSLANPDVEVVNAEVTGGTEELADLVVDRYREAVACGGRLECDVCGRSGPLPGSENEDGRPQFHPGDGCPTPGHGRDGRDRDHHQDQDHGGHSHRGDGDANAH